MAVQSKQDEAESTYLSVTSCVKLLATNSRNINSVKKDTGRKPELKIQTQQTVKYVESKNSVLQ